MLHSAFMRVIRPRRCPPTTTHCVLSAVNKAQARLSGNTTNTYPTQRCLSHDNAPSPGGRRGEHTTTTTTPSLNSAYVSFSVFLLLVVHCAANTRTSGLSTSVFFSRQRGFWSWDRVWNFSPTSRCLRYRHDQHQSTTAVLVVVPCASRPTKEAN